ncbi:hypothetical protein H6P81_011030 [Aristolochia fimbriata]|uniref:YbaK/aminoacyl-tRNA synthetase-associated domain-containing protein n=1 Tax=Aristolochia fimbriata TaxID=158543 RepID=A0AAV7EQF2_ARIFI|nr:hypothetical protein H6P81_011030 [Aristolochia fimbriata]
MGYSKEELLARLKELQIEFVICEHPVVLTVEAQAKYVGHLGGALSKNLLLKDKKHRFYVVSALAGTNVDLKVLSQRLGLGKGGLRMAPEEALQDLLQVPLGCVTPFALINESARTISLLLDQGFKAQERCLFHPLSNDTTISLTARDLDKFLISIGVQPSYVDLEANPVVGKDQRPDLAAFVPSDARALPDTVEKKTKMQISPDNHAKSAEVVGNDKVHSAAAKGGVEKPKRSSDPLASVTDVKKFVDEIIQKTSMAVLSEVNMESSKEPNDQLGHQVLDGVRKRISLDLESLAMIFKNAAYAQGFHSGRESALLKK